MAANCDLSSQLVQKIRKNPIHSVLLDLGRAAVEAHVHKTDEFRKLIAYLLELADGRDRREPMIVPPGTARPVPKLRIAVEQCFGNYVDLHWFRLNKAINESGQPLLGLFPRFAASMSRVDPEDFGRLVQALVQSSPDTALLRVLHKSGGKLPRVGLPLFSRLAFAFRRELYFIIPPEWGTASGALRFVGDDLRRYCALCRTLRAICDEVEIDAPIRGTVFHRAMQADQIYPPLLATLNKTMAPTIGRAMELDPADGYVSATELDVQTAMPLEFTASAILARRGQKSLRRSLGQVYKNRCAITGTCPKDLLEVAYIVAFPRGDVNSSENAIMLRADLHTLWDLNLIGVEPETHTVHIAERLRGSVYENLEKRRLLDRSPGSRISEAALRERWDGFVQAHEVAQARPIKKKIARIRVVGDRDEAKATRVPASA